MINFDIEKKGYNKEQVTKYFERVQAEYEELYSENQALRFQLQQTQQQLDRERSRVSDIPPDRMEAIALALVSAQTEAQRIVNTAREKAWQILTDAKKGIPAAEEPHSPNLLTANQEPNSVEPSPAQPQNFADVRESQSAAEYIDELIESILSKKRSGGD